MNRAAAVQRGKLSELNDYSSSKQHRFTGGGEGVRMNETSCEEGLKAQRQ
jgi:hypothetical protein